MRPRLPLGVIAALLVCAHLSGQTFHRVERIIDGDTVVLAGVGTVRLIGVDSPETTDPRQPVQALGREAAAFLSGVLAGKSARLEYDQTLQDKFGRTLAYLYLPDGTFVNREIVRQGYNHAYAEFPFKFLNDFRGVEREARTAERGLWADPQPAPAASLGLVSAVQPSSVSATVYITRTGEKYHRNGCRYLARSKIPITLKEAAGRYGPCSVCRPPTR